ncbi:MAG: SDR family NAD(P)-dependent oxidoreductase [Magnetococcus sp. YQC-5]
MKTYLVTGGAGFIGSHLVDALLTTGQHVVVLDDLSSGKRENVSSEANLVVGNVRDRTLVTSLMEEVDGCFHLAAVPSVVRSHQDWRDTHTVNLTGTVTVLEAARSTPKRRAIPVVFASSAAVYGDNPNAPLKEDAITRPLSAYGADKLGSELHARVGGAVHGIPTLGLRLFNVFGPRQDPHSPYSGVISQFVERAQQGMELIIHGDGMQVRDFVYVFDVVRFFVRAIECSAPDGQVVNVCTGHPITIRDLAGAVISLTGNRSSCIHTETRAGDIRVSIGSPEHAAQYLGLRAETNLHTGLKTILEHARR